MTPLTLDVNLIALDDHDLGDGRSAEQILKRPEPEYGVFQVLLERPQHDVAFEFLVQVQDAASGNEPLKLRLRPY